MGKNKRQRLAGISSKKHKPSAKPLPKHQKSTSKPTTAKKPPPSQKAQAQNQHQNPTIPFAPSDRILLIGDGDLSFACSLVREHGCTHVTATVLEKTLDELREKYPHVEANMAELEAKGQKVVFGVDAGKMGVWDREGRCAGSGKGRKGGVDRVVFNFPHVGGKSTDVNRQVRYNQELLVNFFRRSIPSLAPHGSIIVTLFEGMPYTLWNIRDLARHSGLAVERSFKFQATAYPGYHHARTLGVVKTGAGEKSETGWKGEERPARSFVFVRKEDVTPTVVKRKRGDDETESEDGVDSAGDEVETTEAGSDSEAEIEDGSGVENQD